MNRLLENETLQRIVDYSFGDHSGVLGGVPNAFMKKANESNTEFLQFVHKQTEPITLFIDNIRLYRRPLEYSDWMHLKPISEQDRGWLDQFDDEDLLALCSKLPSYKFIIFTAFEDTPLDDYIWDKIPPNVLSINAANAVVFGGKVRPFPHGIERIMHEGYDHHDTLIFKMSGELRPSKLLFVAHRSDTGNRASLGEMFKDKDWTTVTHLPYSEYLHEMMKHKFVLCPSGNGIESARNWETLYMRRVPVFKDHPYLREMFKDFPCLFVSDFSDVTEELLKENDYLYQQAQNIDMEKLTLDYWFKKSFPMTAEEFNLMWGFKYGILVKQNELPSDPEFKMSYSRQEQFAKNYKK